jgi:hypothetical protein
MTLAAAGDGFTLIDLAWALLLFVVFAVWLWLLVLIFGDLFRRDVSGLVKVCWTVALIVLPYLGVLGYLLVEGRGIVARRGGHGALGGHDGGDRAPRPEEQIAAAKRLLDSGAISEDEYGLLKQRILGGSTTDTGTRPKEGGR